MDAAQLDDSYHLEAQRNFAGKAHVRPTEQDYHDSRERRCLLDYLVAAVGSCVQTFGAARKGAELRKAMAEAKLVHVISTRYRKHASTPSKTDPFKCARELKFTLEVLQTRNRSHKVHGTETGGGAVFVFDPNGDNAFLMSGDAESANVSLPGLEPTTLAAA